MYFIDNQNITDPKINLALEEYCLRNLDMTNDEFLLFYINEPSVIIGRNQNTLEEINSKYIQAEGVHVVRRVSGGGAVYHDLGNLNFSFITKYDHNHLNNFKKFTTPVIEALNKIGVPAELTGRNDIVADGRKISGNAQYSTGRQMLSHGTLLFNSQIDAVVNALNVKADKIASKGLKSVRSRVSNISEFLEDVMDMTAFKDHLLKSIFTLYGGVQEYTLTPQDWKAVKSLSQEKYGAWAWNYGRSPQFDIQRIHRFNIGQIDARLKIAAGGSIEMVKFYGDFLGYGDMEDIEKQLGGVRYRRKDVKAVLKDITLNRYFGEISLDEFVDFLVME